MPGYPTDADPEFLERLNERMKTAQERLRFAEAEVLRWKRHIAGLKEVIETALVGAAETHAQETLLQTSVSKRPLARMTIKDAVCTILQQQNGPLSVREILDALHGGGRKVGGMKPTDTLRSLLRNYDDVFARTSDHKWTFVNGRPPWYLDDSIKEE